MKDFNNTTEEYLLDRFVVERIGKLMENHSLTRYRLCKLTGITQASLSTILSGKCAPSLLSIERLCKGLGISVSDFFMTGNEVEYLLTKNERDLLALWNSLDKRQQDMTVGFIQGIIAEGRLR